MLRMDASLIPQSNHGIMVDEELDHGSMSSSSSGDSSSNSVGSSSSEFMDDATSSASSSSPPPSEDRQNKEQNKEGPLYEMSSLMAQLPFKRGLSKFYEGKSQSYACLSNVRRLEDLAKPERPCKKRLKSSLSCGGGLDNQRTLSPMGCSKVITKKASRGSFSSLINARRHGSFMGSKPPIHPQRPSNISSPNLLFA